MYLNVEICSQKLLLIYSFDLTLGFEIVFLFLFQLTELILLFPISNNIITKV